MVLNWVFGFLLAGGGGGRLQADCNLRIHWAKWQVEWKKDSTVKESDWFHIIAFTYTDMFKCVGVRQIIAWYQQEKYLLLISLSHIWHESNWINIY